MTSAPTYRDGRVHVCEQRCSTCIFRPGNPMHLGRGRVAELVRDALSRDGGPITCHATLDSENAICHGFWNGFRQTDNRCCK